MSATVRGLLGILLLAISLVPLTVVANTECVWATGRLVCHKNQTKVMGSQVDLWDLDSPRNIDVKNPVDPDDKAGFTIVDNPLGLWNLDGCASDVDWLGLKNRPEFYLKVHHYCNTDAGETKIVMPVFQVFTPLTYDRHIDEPIELD